MQNSLTLRAIRASKNKAMEFVKENIIAAEQAEIGVNLLGHYQNDTERVGPIIPSPLVGSTNGTTLDRGPGFWVSNGTHYIWNLRSLHFAHTNSFLLFVFRFCFSNFNNITV